jgi:hypothetical protein
MKWTRRSLIQNVLSASAAAVALSGKSASAQALSGPSHVATEDAMPNAARIAIADFLQFGARLRPGQKVLLLAYLDGLYGGDNLVDRQAMHWIQRAIEERGNQVEMLWYDEPARMHAWRFPPEVRAAMDRNDVVVNNTFDLTIEENLDFREYVEHIHKSAPMSRNFATTAPLLCTAWAQTPNELVSEIRYQAARRIVPGLKWDLTDPNGTHLEGVILPARNVTNAAHNYAVRREESNSYYPWPEWVCPPIVLGDTNGTFTFDRMLSWWSRYIGIAPYFERPITLTIRDGRIQKIAGGREAEALRAFMATLAEKLGESTYTFDTLHFGVHPQARVAPQQCPSALYRRMIEHSDTHNLHVHVGSPKATKEYPYWPHITGDLRQPTFRIGDKLVHENGRLTALDDPEVLAVAAKYPGRPGLAPEPFQG